MFGLLGLGAGLLGFGSANRGQRKERDRQLGAIAEQDAVLTDQLAQEEDAYRKGLRKSRDGVGVGAFASRMASSRQFTGF